ncbi:helix-turn-helix domain-containing protein [Ectopseudomonas mendocina]|nr:helix-turn-helix domain-containing protein [Pseudomonas mendocina]
MKTDRRELTDLEKAECAALKAEIAARNARNDGSRKLTQEYLGQELGMTQGNLSSHLNGKRPISKEMAAKMAVLLDIPVERFSPRLAKEIAEMAEAVRPRAAADSVSEKAGRYQADRAEALMDFATPRTRTVLERINQAALAGRLSEADLDLLDQIAARFESSEGTQPASQHGSHKRLKDKLQKNDPHPKQ